MISLLIILSFRVFLGKNIFLLWIFVHNNKKRFLNSPQVIFARLVVLASVPFIESRGCHILTFMQHFAANLNKHLAPLWDQRIPLLLHYLASTFLFWIFNI